MSAAATPEGAQAPPSDEEMRKLLKPNATDVQVLTALSQTYPAMKLKIVKELESYDDKNYLVADEANDAVKYYLAKVHNGVESLDYINKRPSSSSQTSVIDLQNAIFSHLKAVDGVTTSAPIPPTHAEDGAVVSLHDLPVMSSAHSPSSLVVRLLTWVPGVPLSSVPSTSITAESLAGAGAYLGKLRHALDDLAQTNADAVQASKRYHVWDGRNTLDLANFTRYIANEDRRALVTSVLDAFRDTFGETGTKIDFPMGILMGDYNDANILIDGGKVSGVIDFGDSVYR
jgi:Ser/Thr protein kinase RdoA (MazF antagonist)